ncbi:MAG: YihY/virulence factor BrkB family protein [Bacteroidota bacterium]|nr:YihY/virulence factor BrkB family protein [Bacteroidota bacterium]
MPGFDGAPIYDVARFFWSGITKGSIGLRAAAFTYNFFLSLFPAIIFFFTIIPYIPIPHFQDTLMQIMQDIIPDRAYQAVESTLLDVIKRPHGGLLSLGFVLAMYFSTNGINSLMVAFNQSIHQQETRPYYIQQVVSIFLVLIISFIIIIAIGLITIGPPVLRFLVENGFLKKNFTFYIIGFLRWVVIVGMFLFAFSFLYYMAPAGRNKFRFISAGSMLSTILTIAASIGFNYYVNNFSKYNTLYGSIGTLMIVMIWINFNAFVVLIGFELNASIRGAKKFLKRGS